MIRFSFDGDPVVFTAHGHGPRWNGWLCPIVDAHTLSAVITRLAEITDDRYVQLALHDARGATFTEHEKNSDGQRGDLLTEHNLSPDADGHYLLDLGLTLYQR
ncbi:hypothetical protein [Mycolicibacterium mageritense]|uniref:hypothetical protein n=1 Tax=Mycolicibacterium mageritense TaxID=53462 RepID=UPI0011D4EBF7|nr:hypothetical protein [Mycolicibacterium mageritense]TXI53176.1 MAG: hypothetical protein E6Q55_35855 [Mycolicibacterium mageritense]